MKVPACMCALDRWAGRPPRQTTVRNDILTGEFLATVVPDASGAAGRSLGEHAGNARDAASRALFCRRFWVLKAQHGSAAEADTFASAAPRESCSAPIVRRPWYDAAPGWS